MRYDFKCETCGYIHEILMSVEEYKKMLVMTCPACGGNCKRFFGNQKNSFAIPETFMHGVFDHGTGKTIRQHDIRDFEKRSGRVLGGDKELDQEADKNRARIEREQADRTKKELYREVCERVSEK